MKKTALLTFLLFGCIQIAILVFTAFKTPKNEISAKVEINQGYFIFHYCKPAENYLYLGTEKIKISWSGKPAEMLEIMIKKARKNYPGSNGIIFTGVEMDQAQIIEFD